MNRMSWQIISELKEYWLGIVLAEDLSDQLVHGERAAMNINGRWVIQRTYFFENFVGYVAFVVFPIFIRSFIKDVVYLYAVSHALELFSQHDILFILVGKQQNNFNVFVLHGSNLHDCLEDRCDATSSCHIEQSFRLIRLFIYLTNQIPIVTIPPVL